MGLTLQRMFLGLAAAAAVGTGVLALDHSGTVLPRSADAVAQGSATQAVVGAVPATSNPVLGRESPAALEELRSGAIDAPVPQPVEATEQDWEEQRAAMEDAAWATTEATVTQLSTSGRWTDAERQDVVAALSWRHEQMVETRRAIQAGDVQLAAGRATLVSVANKARNAVIHAVGTERAAALDNALTDSGVGSGL